MKRIVIALMVGAALITGAANLPLAWLGNVAIPKSVQPRPVFLGTFWKGQITNIEGINPVNLSLTPSNFFTGKDPISFDSHSPFLRFSGTASLRGSITGRANGNITGLRVFDNRFQALNGTYDLILSNVIVQENCTSAQGQLSTNILSENFESWQWRGPILSGPISCEDGKFITTLSGADGRQSLTAVFQIDLAGQYRAIIKVDSTDPQAEFVLPLYGFEKTPEGYSLSEAGTWN